MKSDIDTYIRSSRAEFEEKLQDWVEIPTISAEPAHKPDIEPARMLRSIICVHWAQKPTRYGLPVIPLLPQDSSPVKIGQR